MIETLSFDKFSSIMGVLIIFYFSLLLENALKDLEVVE